MFYNIIYNNRWKKCVSIDLNSEFQIVLVDFGNACWINKHFSEKIQTKEYRSPESIIGAEYNVLLKNFSNIIFRKNVIYGHWDV